MLPIAAARLEVAVYPRRPTPPAALAWLEEGMVKPTQHIKNASHDS